jgi:hypothetical protein
VVLYGTLDRIVDADEMRVASAALLDHLAVGRGADARPPSDTELLATLMLRLVIEEGSAKVRTGGPLDDPDDLDLPVWAGQLPLQVVAADPVPDSGGIQHAVPAYVRDHHLRRLPGGEGRRGDIR